jgi:hypothetical protein
MKELEWIWKEADNPGTILELVGGTEENYENPLRISGVLAKIQTEHLLNIMLPL